MRPLPNKHLHGFIRFFTGKANFCRIKRLIQRSLTEYMGKLILLAGKSDKGQSSGNKFYRALLLILSVLDWESKFVSSRRKLQVIAELLPKFATQRRRIWGSR